MHARKYNSLFNHYRKAILSKYDLNSNDLNNRVKVHKNKNENTFEFNNKVTINQQNKMAFATE